MNRLLAMSIHACTCSAGHKRRRKQGIAFPIAVMALSLAALLWSLLA